MIDVRLLRTDLPATRDALARRGKAEVVDLLEEAAGLDARARDVGAARDAVRAGINDLSQQVGVLRREKRADEAEALMARSRDMGDQERDLQAEYDAMQVRLREVLLAIPNLPHPDAPDGRDDADNPVVIGPVGMPAEFAAHQRVPHWETAAALGILDNERATKIAGAMFTMQRGAGATMARALCQYALDANADAFEEIRPPSLVTTATLTATGHLPKFADDAYAIERDGLWAIPTAEVPLTSLHRDELIPAEQLPLRYAAYTPCFRREAGSYGRDTRGLIRLHQFNKVEMYWFTRPEDSEAAHEQLTRDAEGVLEALELPYRRIELCGGDLGFSAARTYDLEVWLAGAGAYREISSCSTCGDFQARRSSIRVKDKGKGTRLVHTLNGSGLAVGRTMAALLEAGQQSDGTVRLPKALVPYFGHDTLGDPPG